METLNLAAVLAGLKKHVEASLASGKAESEVEDGAVLLLNLVLGACGLTALEPVADSILRATVTFVAERAQVPA